MRSMIMEQQKVHMIRFEKGEELLKVGLTTVKEFRESEAQQLFAREPHELMRCLEALDILTIQEMVMRASLARKAGSKVLNFERMDYSEIDPPEWDKFLTIRQENGEVKVGDRPKGYWGDFDKGYRSHCSPEK